jgi:16S rRNA processing protein RimM
VDEPTVVVGVIAKAHGLQGEVVVHSRSDNPERWAPGSVMFLGERTLTIEQVRPLGARLLVKFESIDDRSSAETLRGEVVVPVSWLPELPQGEYWPHELQGCLVVTEGGRVLGPIVDVIPNQANDLWVAVDEQGNETLVPALADVVSTVDVADKRVVVRDIPGLTAPEG